MGEVKIKKKAGAFPAASQVDADALYFKTDTNNVQLKLGSMPLKHDVVSLKFIHGQDSTTSVSVLEATSDYINTLYDGLKIVISEIDENDINGRTYRFGSESTIISINGVSDKMIYDVTGTNRLTSIDIEPGTTKYAHILQYVSSIESNSGGWIIIGQYNALPTSGGTMSGNIDMNNNTISNLADAVYANDAVTKQQTITLDTNGDFSAGNNTSKIVGVADPENNYDVANKHYVDSSITTAIENIDINPTVAQDAFQIDGTKDYNFLYIDPVPASSSYTIGVQSGKEMIPGHMCHIFIYNTGPGTGMVETPGYYNENDNRTIMIPSDFRVGGQSANDNNNHVRKEVGKNIKDKKRDKRGRDGVPSREGSLKKREVSKHQETFSLPNLCRALEAQRAT